MNVLKLARKDRRRHPPDLTDGERARYEVDPDEMYPTALAYLSGLTASGAEYPPCLTQYVEAARSLPPGAWRAAEGRASDSPDGAYRTQALELARLAFTALLREAAGGPIGLRITASDRWRL